MAPARGGAPLEAVALPLKDKILFSFGGLGANTVFQAVTAWLIYFWSGQGDPTKALIPIGLLGILLGIGRFIEAFDDPLIGHLSDINKSRWGRRFPFIFFGAPFLAVSFFLLWNPPQTADLIFSAIFFFVTLQLFFLAYTFVQAPYEGILPEIAKTSAERVSTSAWRVLFGVIGAAIGLIGSSLLIQWGGFPVMGAVLGIIALIAFWVAIFGIRKRLVKAAPVGEISLPKALFSTLKNTQFLVFSASLILFSLGLNLLTALLPFYVKIILQQSEGLVALFSGLVLAGAVLALPLHTLIARRKGKKWSYLLSMLALGLLFPTLAFVGLLPLPIDAFWQLAVLAVLIGIPLAGQFIFPNAILADVIDYDQLQTGLRREAIYYGMQNTLQKFSFAAASILFGTTLAIFGSTFEQNLGIRLIGPLAASTTIIGFVIFSIGYKLPDEISPAQGGKD